MPGRAGGWIPMRRARPVRSCSKLGEWQMSMKEFLLECIAPAAILLLLVYAMLWSIVDFFQGGV